MTPAQALLPSPLAEHLPLLLWEMDCTQLDPQDMYKLIIERVIERGTREDWAGMLAYYGEAQVREVALAAPYLSEAATLAVCQVLGLEKTSLCSYQRKQTDPVPFDY